MRYRIIKDTSSPSAASRRAAELARELGAAMMLPTVMMYLGEFALVCMVTNRTGRKALEELVGERLPNSLWKELKAMVGVGERTELPRAGALRVERLRECVALASLGLAAATKGGRLQVEQRCDRKFTDKEWAALERNVVQTVPRLKKVWRQMREAGMVELPKSLLG